MATLENFEVDQGADFELVVTYSDSSNTPINLTGYSARMKIKKNFDSSSILTLTDGSGITLGGALGTVTINITSTQTKAFDFVKALFDLEIISGAGKVTRLLQGTLSLNKEVTND